MTKAQERPSLARKVTPKDEANRADGLDQGVSITIDGEAYAVRVGDLTAPIARDLRRVYGGSFTKLQEELATDPDIDSISTLVWLARRLRGERLDLDDVSVDYHTLLADGFSIAVAGAEVVDDSPEA